MSKWGAQYAHKTDAFSDTEFWRRDADRALEAVFQGRRMSPVLVEVGCGTGRLLKKMRAYWRDATIIGVDVNTAGFDLCAQRAPRVELHTTLDPVMDASVDACVILHAFEQFSDPTDMMLKVWNKLKPYGQLVIVLHNPYFALAMRLKWLLQGYKSDPTITSRLTRRQLAQFMVDHGFRVESLTYFGGGPLGFVRWLQPRLLLVARRPS